jgi:S-adenosyl-L-methionine hydrolase (adenosine-forming)
MNKKIITLITDFGTKAGYVGAFKGVILKINPEVSIVDITHEVNPFDVWEGAWVLNSCYEFFPLGTIFLIIVDPGVGGPRKPLLIKSENCYFVGPDNGVFSFIYEKESARGGLEIVHITDERYFIGKPSSTFHGRDIFAPVAAYVSLGVKIDEFGKRASECFKFKIPSPQISKNEIIGEVLYIDGFGNLITNIDQNLVDKIERMNSLEIIFKRKKIEKISKSYFEGRKREILALVGSTGFLEISANQGNAQRILRAKKGDKVIIDC